MEFKIIKQQDQGLGCIPACAASVLNYLQIRGGWTESEILGMYWQKHLNTLGFELLKNFLEKQNILGNLQIHIEAVSENFRELILQKNKRGIPILCHKKPAHCVVIFCSDESSVKIFDPALTAADSTTMPYSQIRNIAGSFLWFEEAKK
jgi:ABC-type bacteriocin/lantibiotic exporter with double-glycine peptidase domain